MLLFPSTAADLGPWGGLLRGAVCGRGQVGRPTSRGASAVSGGTWVEEMDVPPHDDLRGSCWDDSPHTAPGGTMWLVLPVGWSRSDVCVRLLGWGWTSGLDTMGHVPHLGMESWERRLRSVTKTWVLREPGVLGRGCGGMLSLGASFSGGRAAPAGRGPRPEQETGRDSIFLPE